MSNLLLDNVGYEAAHVDAARREGSSNPPLIARQQSTEASVTEASIGPVIDCFRIHRKEGIMSPNERAQRQLLELASLGN